MNCLHITLLFNIVAGIVQTFIKSCNQLPYPRVIEVCRLHFEPRHDFFLHLIIVVELFPTEMLPYVKKQVEIAGLPQAATICLWISAGRSHLRWEIVWGNALRIWGEFGSALPFKTRLTHTKSVQPPNEHGSQVKDQGRRQCWHYKHKNLPIGLHVMYLYFLETPRNLILCNQANYSTIYKQITTQ